MTNELLAITIMLTAINAILAIAILIQLKKILAEISNDDYFAMGTPIIPKDYNGFYKNTITTTKEPVEEVKETKPKVKKKSKKKPTKNSTKKSAKPTKNSTKKNKGEKK